MYVYYIFEYLNKHVINYNGNFQKNESIGCYKKLQQQPKEMDDITDYYRTVSVLRIKIMYGL